MKFGIVSLWRESLDDFVAEVRTAEKLGFDVIGVGDTHAGYREVYVSLTVAALNTSAAALGPMVTNPVTRHPAVTTSAIASIDRLSGGRAVLGIGTGGSAVWTVGRPPAKIDDFRSSVQAIRDLMTAGATTLDGRRIAVSGVSRRVPIFITAEGPRALGVAGALADAVVLHTGTSAEAISWCLRHLRDGAQRAGRDPAEVEVWMMLKASVADDREEALAHARSGLAGSAVHALRTGAREKGVPEHLLQPLTDLVARYDPSEHAMASSRNGDLIDELGLTEFLADAFGLIGTPDECAERLRSLAALGVQGVITPALSPDPLRLIERLGREVLPKVRA